MESVKHINWRFLQKALTADSLYRFRKKFHLGCLKMSKIIPTLTLMNPTPPNY